MNKVIFSSFIAFSFCMLQSTYAQLPVAVVQSIQPSVTSITWISKNSSDDVAINNGNGNKLTVTINVDKSPNTANPVGVNIKNCGNTTHIDAGSSAICTSSDASNPISFFSDSPSYGASGTYSIKQD